MTHIPHTTANTAKQAYKTLIAGLTMLVLLCCGNITLAQAPGTAPVSISNETQMLHGRKYYVHIVEKGQTVYSISRAYKVESYDAVTHVDIHFLHPGDTVWIPYRGQFPANGEKKVVEPEKQATPTTQQPSTTTTKADHGRVTPSTRTSSTTKATTTTKTSSTTKGNNTTSTTENTTIPEVRTIGKTVKVALMMPLHLDQIDEISTSKFDIDQRGKKKYRQFEFIEFYEGLMLALDKLAANGANIELNVVDVNGNNAQDVESAFTSHNVAQSDVLIALLMREGFDRAASLAQENNIYIVNPMSTRSEICATNPFVVKTQPSLHGRIALMLNNIKLEHPDAHLYIIHSNNKNEKAALDEMKRQLDERHDIRYTLFNWSMNAKLVSTLKNTPNCCVVSLYDQSRDQNRVFAGNLLNRLAAIKANSPTLYTFNDWTKEYTDIDFAQLQQLNYHTFYTSWDMTNEVHVGFLQEYRNRYGTEPSTELAATGYDIALHIIGGLAHTGNTFWQKFGASTIPLTQPIRLERRQAGIENCRAQLYRLTNLRFIPAATK